MSTPDVTAPAITAGTAPAVETVVPANAETAKPVEAQPAEAAKDTAQPVIPDKYELQLPEGVELDLEPWTGTFKEVGLTNDQAQKLVNQQLELSKQSGALLDQALADSRVEWRDLAKADKEIGGPKYEASLMASKAFLAAYGDAELTALLDASGLGDHPAMLRALAKAGHAIPKEDTTVRHASAGNGADPLARLFSKSIPQAGA